VIDAFSFQKANAGLRALFLVRLHVFAVAIP
jgi:hypothetical protein